MDACPFINYQPFSQHEFYLKAFYKQVFRLPTFNEMYYKTLGMSLLKPEFTHQYDFGFTYRKNFSRGIVKISALMWMAITMMSPIRLLQLLMVICLSG